MSYRHLDQLSLVRDEYFAAQACVGFVDNAWSLLVSQGVLGNLRLPQVQLVVTNLEGTYLIRLFAEFEAILRDHLTTAQPHRPVPARAEHLINRVATAYRVSQPVRDGAHNVRRYRNSLVHHRSDAVQTVAFTVAVSALNRFLAWLP